MRGTLQRAPPNCWHVPSDYASSRTPIGVISSAIMTLKSFQVLSLDILRVKIANFTSFYVFYPRKLGAGTPISISPVNACRELIRLVLFQEKQRGIQKFCR